MILTAASHAARGDVLALSDGRAGNARQALALAAALSASSREHLLEPAAPWRWLAPRRLPGSHLAFGPGFSAALQAPPAVAVGCGRQAALATRLLRGRGTRTVQVLDPRLPTRHWDLVVAPEHDGLRGDNVITLAGSLHPVDDAWLAAGRAAFPEPGRLPGPRTAVLIGGPSAHAGFDTRDFEDLAAAVAARAERVGGSLMLVASRRTPDGVRAALRARAWPVAALAWADDRDGPNPYAGVLGWADAVACTPDSVNMLSEACATRVPVFVHRPRQVQGRPRAFLDDLLARGRIHALDAADADGDVQPLRETARVAAEVRARLGLA